jgi:hypothetical protein
MKHMANAMEKISKEAIGKIMTQLGADDYDRHDDMSKLTIRITETLESNKIKWKIHDEEKAKLLIRNQIIQELSRLEERKLAKRN